MRTSPWPTDIAEAPAAAPCPKGRRLPGRIQVILEQANSEAETRREPQAHRMLTAAQQVEAATVSGTARFQAKAVAQGATVPFPVVPAGVQPVPAVPEVRRAWGPVEVVAVVGGADELVIGAHKPRARIANTGY